MTAVRQATPHDAHGIAEVQVETWRATYGGVMPQAALDALDVEERTTNWESWIRFDGSATFVATDGGDVVGFVHLGPCRDDATVGELYAIYVRPLAWSTGAGLALMDAGVGWLSRRWPAAVLWVAEDNPRARRFYELYGWRQGGERTEMFYGAEVPEVRYRLSGLDGR